MNKAHLKCLACRKKISTQKQSFYHAFSYFTQQKNHDDSGDKSNLNFRITEFGFRYSEHKITNGSKSTPSGKRMPLNLCDNNFSQSINAQKQLLKVVGVSQTLFIGICLELLEIRDVRPRTKGCSIGLQNDNINLVVVLIFFKSCL